MEIHDTLDNGIYHQNPRYSSSQLKLALDCPARLKYSRENPSDPTEAMRFGTMFHTALFEPETFSSQYILAPKVDKRTAKGRAEWVAFEELAGNREHVREDELKEINEMCASVRRHVFSPVIENPLCVERSIFFDYELPSGRVIPLRVRPDLIHPHGIMVDAKTTSSAKPDDFAKAIVNFGYDLSAAMYLEGARAAGMPCSRFVFIAVEKSDPYLSAFYEMDELFIDRGKRRFIEACEIVMDCEESGIWPGYSDEDVRTISCPRWAL